MDPKKRILLVEDDPEVHDLYKRVLEDIGIEIISAYDGQEGLDLATKIPDLILLDIMLPKIDGMEVLKRLKDQDSTKKIPIVLVTNLAQDNVASDAYKLGAQGYLIKVMIDPGQLVEYVKKYLADPAYRMGLGLQN